MMEYEHEPVRGLPGRLPDGERMLWQGSPQWWPIARHVLHIRGVAIYFMLIIAWAGSVVYRESGLTNALAAAAWVLPVAIVAITLLCGLAVAMARTTVYTLTDRRIVMRFGVALPMAVNLPLSKVAAVSMHCDADGTGNIALDIGDRPAIGYFRMWPHARPFWLSRTQPMLRAIRNPVRVAELMREPLARTLQNDGAIEVSSPAPGRPSHDTLQPARTISGGHRMGQQAVAHRAQD